MEFLHPTLFNKDDTKNWKEFLEREGYVVIKNIEEKKVVLSDILDQFKKDWTTVSPKFDFSVLW